MDYLQGDSYRAAKKAEKKEDYLRAGDLYMLAGDEIKGMEMYLKGRSYAQAAKILEEREHWAAAAHCYSHAGDFGKAARIYLRLKDFEKAALFFERSQEYVRASEVWADLGNLVKAAEVAEKGDSLDRAAALYARAGILPRAAELYDKLVVQMGQEPEQPGLMEGQRNAIRRFSNAAGDLHARLKDYGKAADCYLKAGATLKAAGAFKAAERYEKAADLYAEAGEFQTASQILESIGKMAKASSMAEKAGKLTDAAVLACKAGQIFRAAGLFAKANDTVQAAELYFQLLIESIDQSAALGRSGTPLADRNLAHTCGTLYLRLQQHAKAGWCYERAGDSTRAAECYVNGKLYEKAAEMYAAIKDYPKTMEFLEKAGDVQNKALLAETCFQVGRYQEAAQLFASLEQLERAAEAFDRAGEFLKAALLYQEISEFGKAASLLEKADENKRAAVLYEQAGQFLEAAKLFEALGDLEGATRCILQTEDKVYAGRLFIKQGKSQEAIALLQSIGSADLCYRQACGLLGDLFLEIGMYSPALQKYTEAVADEPVGRDNVDACYGMSVVLEKTGKADKALEILEKIVAVRFDYKDVLERVKRLQKPAARPASSRSVPQKRAAKHSEPAPPLSTTSYTLEGGTFVSTTGKRIREYEILEELGSGGTSRVYRVRHIYLKAERAIKVIRRSMIEAGSADRFLREARILGELHHPNLVQLFEFGTLDNGAFFMVLELVRGESAAARVKREGRIPIDLALRVVREAALGLKAAHEKGIIHRDVSPDNLILSSDADGNEMTKVVDFGIAKVLVDETTNMLSTTSFLGRPQYSSPEQCGFLKQGETIDQRTDIYSLAVTLHYLLSGSLPYSSPTPQGYLVKHLTQEPVPLVTAFPECPPELSMVVLRALSPAREDRPESMDRFISEVDQSLSTRRRKHR